MTSKPEVNIPLLRKAVEWVESQEALPPETRQWMQSYWVTPEEERVGLLRHPRGCGTAYCVAGWIAAQKHPELAHTQSAVINGVLTYSSEVAMSELGLSEYEDRGLFNGANTAANIRRIAEEIAGEKL